MNSFVAILHNSLMLTRARYRSDCSVDKAETVFKGGSFSMDNIGIFLQKRRAQDSVIPLGDSMAVSVENAVNYCVGNHAKLWHGSCKSTDHVRVATWLRKSL